MESNFANDSVITKIKTEIVEDDPVAPDIVASNEAGTFIKLEEPPFIAENENTEENTVQITEIPNQHSNEIAPKRTHEPDKINDEDDLENPKKPKRSEIDKSTKTILTKQAGPEKNNMIASYTCPECPYRSIKKADFKIHFQCHLEKAGKKCAYCSFSATSGTMIKKHEVIHRNKKLPMKCRLCTFASTTKKGLKQHMLVAHNKALTTDMVTPTLCKDSTNNEPIEIKREVSSPVREILDINESAVNVFFDANGNRWFKCTAKGCPFKTNTDLLLKRHRANHQNRGQLKCRYCSFRCKGQTQLTSHLFQHVESQNDSQDSVDAQPEKNKVIAIQHGLKDTNDFGDKEQIKLESSDMINNHMNERNDIGHNPNHSADSGAVNLKESEDDIMAVILKDEASNRCYEDNLVKTATAVKRQRRQSSYPTSEINIQSNGTDGDDYIKAVILNGEYSELTCDNKKNRKKRTQRDSKKRKDTNSKDSGSIDRETCTDRSTSFPNKNEKEEKLDMANKNKNEKGENSTITITITTSMSSNDNDLIKDTLVANILKSLGVSNEREESCNKNYDDLEKQEINPEINEELLVNAVARNSTARTKNINIFDMLDEEDELCSPNDHIDNQKDLNNADTQTPSHNNCNNTVLGKTTVSAHILNSFDFFNEEGEFSGLSEDAPASENLGTVNLKEATDKFNVDKSVETIAKSNIRESLDVSIEDNDVSDLYISDNEEKGYQCLSTTDIAKYETLIGKGNEKLTYDDTEQNEDSTSVVYFQESAANSNDNNRVGETTVLPTLNSGCDMLKPLDVPNEEQELYDLHNVNYIEKNVYYQLGAKDVVEYENLIGNTSKNLKNNCSDGDILRIVEECVDTEPHATKRCNDNEGKVYCELSTSNIVEYDCLVQNDNQNSVHSCTDENILLRTEEDCGESTENVKSNREHGADKKKYCELLNKNIVVYENLILNANANLKDSCSDGELFRTVRVNDTSKQYDVFKELRESNVFHEDVVLGQSNRNEIDAVPEICTEYQVLQTEDPVPADGLSSNQTSNESELGAEKSRCANEEVSHLAEQNSSRPPLDPGKQQTSVQESYETIVQVVTLKDITVEPVTVNGKTIFQCPHCPAIMENLNWAKVHMIGHFSSGGVKCPICTFTADKTNMLKHVMLHVINNEQGYRCPLCDVEKRNQENMGDHLKVVHSRDIFQKHNSICKKFNCRGTCIKRASLVKA